MKKNILIGIIIIMNLGLIYLIKQNKKKYYSQLSAWAKKTQHNDVENTINSFIANKYWWELNSQRQQKSVRMGNKNFSITQK